jgi:ABC-2 type transport system ATP-binding protein
VALIAGGRLIALATPDDLRRQAVGGDMIEVELGGPYDPAPLRSMPGVHAIETVDAGTLRVTVDDAATALPDILEAVRSSGADAAGAREIRPSFDEVFAILVERERASRAAAEAADATAAEREGAA